ncbi:MAG: RNase H family protein [Planctomycetota bacterium]
MKLSLPQYVLVVDVDGRGSGCWRFAVCDAHGRPRFEASDVEPSVRGNRLELLTLVRALEALDEPAKVSLIGCSTYVRHGLQQGLSDWRGSGWKWEFYGRMAPVRNGDLWQRLDRALGFHDVRCVARRVDTTHARSVPGPRWLGGRCRLSGVSRTDSARGVRASFDNWVRFSVLSIKSWYRGRVVPAFLRWRKSFEDRFVPTETCVSAS